MAEPRKPRTPRKPPGPKAKTGKARRTRTRAGSRAAAAPAEPNAPRDFLEYELADEAVERSLLSGDNAGLLEDYFGPESYEELRQLAREASSRAVRGGPRVLILPGIMGSKIGKHRLGGLFDDTYWLDPVDIAMGRLAELRLPDQGKFGAIGVLLTAYLKLKLRLKIAGFDADFHPFDWRKSIAELGAELKARLAKEGGDKVSLVAHSMGGLVGRWALGAGAKCKRLVMLGTPNFGSFAPLLALRAVNEVVVNLGKLDRKHQPEAARWLSEHVFSTFPGLIEMLPSPQVFSNLDLYDLATWPDDGMVPAKAALAGARAVQEALLDQGDNLFLIAGVNQDTVTGARRTGDEFEYERSKAGDGTVPLSFCLLPAIAERTYYVEEGHGSLPNNGLVEKAVCELLDRGRTELLPQQPPAQRTAGRWVSEGELRASFAALRAAGPMGRRELRNLVRELAAPDARATVTASLPPGAAEGFDLDGFEHRFDHVVVGRRKQHRLEIRLAKGSITEADTRAIALGIFRDVTPRGAALALDQRLGGAITDLTRRRMFSGDVGEVFMMPTGRHPLAADQIAFVGLGAFDRFNDDVLETAAENILRMFVQTRVEEFATVVFGGGSGKNPARALRSLLAGFVRGLVDADHDHIFRRVVICERDAESFMAIKQELFRLSSTPLCEGVEVTFDETLLPQEMQVGAGAVARHLAPGPEPSYLIVRLDGRSELADATDLDVRSSLLTAGGKATVVSGLQRVSRQDFEALVAAAVDETADFTQTGPKLAAGLLAEEVLDVLGRSAENHLVVVHDAPLSKVPWETLGLAEEAGGGDGFWFPAAREGMSRRYAAENLSVAKWLEKRVAAESLEVLLVVNPTGDLPGAAEEGAAIAGLLEGQNGIHLQRLVGGEATRQTLLQELSSGRYDIVHYAGHAFFDERSPERSGLLCAGRQVLAGADLIGLGSLPSLVFFNACESGRVRRLDPPHERGSGGKPKERRRSFVNSIGLAEAFMRGGVANLMGTYWPVGDESAKTFARLFYQEVLRGSTIGEAIKAGRQALFAAGSNDWADYLLYGDANFVMKAAR